jgi:hypothetical protein
MRFQAGERPRVRPTASESQVRRLYTQAHRRVIHQRGTSHVKDHA